MKIYFFSYIENLKNFWLHGNKGKKHPSNPCKYWVLGVAKKSKKVGNRWLQMATERGFYAEKTTKDRY